ncbi:hypothetical protein EYF80_055577 [Liparis tanakae]|uniref:Uncharacterized protein n=1 Tax=Liparis tanakae TaxID=230148 RepID=A0A4Z2EZ65_9TELE|nr:hypothetical protein EYF80_055577 [Liparis tanakae]
MEGEKIGFTLTLKAVKAVGDLFLFFMDHLLFCPAAPAALAMMDRCFALGSMGSGGVERERERLEERYTTTGPFTVDRFFRSVLKRGRGAWTKH